MKKTPLRKKAKPKTRGWYSKKLDIIAKSFAKERDNFICQYSGESVSGSNAHGSHVIPVSAGIALRWDMENIKCLSYHNHMNWWHKNPVEAGEWFKAKFQERWKYISSRRNGLIKVSNVDLIEFYEISMSCDTWREYKKEYDKFFDKYFE